MDEWQPVADSNSESVERKGAVVPSDDDFQANLAAVVEKRKEKRKAQK